MPQEDHVEVGLVGVAADERPLRVGKGKRAERPIPRQHVAEQQAAVCAQVKAGHRFTSSMVSHGWALSHRPGPHAIPAIRVRSTRRGR